MKPAHAIRYCPDCDPAHPTILKGTLTQKRCPECARMRQLELNKNYHEEHKRVMYPDKIIGSTVACTICGGPMVRHTKNQKYCPDCRGAGYRAKQQARMEKIRGYRPAEEERPACHAKYLTLEERMELIARAASVFFDYNPHNPDYFVRQLEEL